MTVIIIAWKPPLLQYIFAHTHTVQNENYSLCCRNIVHVEHEPKPRLIASIENNDHIEIGLKPANFHSHNSSKGPIPICSPKTDSNC